jgi:hypothetical protein
MMATHTGTDRAELHAARAHGLLPCGQPRVLPLRLDHLCGVAVGHLEPAGQQPDGHHPRDVVEGIAVVPGLRRPRDLSEARRASFDQGRVLGAIAGPG